MRVRVLLAVLFLCVTNLFAQDRILDSLENKLSQTSTNLEKVRLYNAISNQYKYSDPNKMLSFGNKAFKLSEKNQMKSEMGTAYLNLGTAYIILGDYEKAMDHFVWAKSLFEELSKTTQPQKEINQGIARALGGMGVVFSEQSNYSKALQYYLEAAEVYEKLNDKTSTSKIYNNIGVVYKSREEPEKALQYFLKALEIQKEREDQNNGITQTNIANIYFKQGKLDEAFKYYSEAKNNIDAHPNPRALGEWYNNIGAYYNARKYPEMALENWQKAVITFKEIDDKFGLADTYLHLAEFRNTQNNKTKALDAAKNASELAKNTQVLEQIVVAEKLLSEIYSQNGNMGKALLYFKKYSAAKDSLYKKNDVRKAVEAAKNYEFEKKELLQKEESRKRELLLKEEAKSTNLKLLFVGLFFEYKKIQGIV